MLPVDPIFAYQNATVDHAIKHNRWDGAGEVRRKIDQEIERALAAAAALALIPDGDYSLIDKLKPVPARIAASNNVAIKSGCLVLGG